MLSNLGTEGVAAEDGPWLSDGVDLLSWTPQNRSHPAGLRRSR
jgi:hypothetical protein